MSLIVLRNDNLNNKPHEANKRDFTFIDHTFTIKTERHFSFFFFHFSLSKPDTIEFAKTLWVFIEAGLINADNSSNISLGNKKGSVPVGVSNSVSEQNIYLKVSQWDSYLRSDHKPAAEDRVFEKIHRALSNPEGKMLPDPHKALENIHHKNVNRLIFTQLNVKSLRLILFIT